MNKEDVISTFVYLIMMAFAIVVGFVVLKPVIDANYLGGGAKLFGFLFLTLIIGLIVNSILIEIGHLIGAKIGKYNILSTCILGFGVFKVKEEEKYRFKFKFPKNYDGLTGETIIAPKDLNSKPMSFVFLPIVMFLLQALACVLVFMYIKDVKNNEMLMYIKYGVFVATCVGGMMIIYDYFPARLDNMNDGYRLVLLNKKININAYNELLRVQKCEYFNEEVGEIQRFEQITDFTAKVNMLSANEYILTDYKKTLEIIDNLLTQEKNMSKNTLFDIKVTKGYILFMNEELEVAKNFYVNEFNDDEKKYLTGCYDINCLRLYLLYEGLVEKSESEISNALDKVAKVSKRILPGSLEKETKLLNLAKEKIGK